MSQLASNVGTHSAAAASVLPGAVLIAATIVSAELLYSKVLAWLREVRRARYRAAEASECTEHARHPMQILVQQSIWAADEGQTRWHLGNTTSLAIQSPAG